MKTRRLLAACSFILTSLSFATVAFADPPARVGRLSYVSGPVSFAPAGLDEWSEAIINRPVTTGDRLWTDSGARAEVHIGSTAVRMAARTNVDVLNLDDSMTQLRLAQGRLNLRVRHLPDGALFEIDTPSTAVQVLRSGSYRIDVDPSGTITTVTVRFGEVTVAGTNASFALYDDESATLYSDSPDHDYTEAPPMDRFDRFCAARDAREDRARSVRYVPYDMTGYEDLDTYGTWATVPAYGTVWFPRRVDPGWVPYRHGHWLWVEPWGWTWVDEAPWGFAPFHYGRWANIGGRWGWCPGEAHARPVYAPALVAFVGGSGFNLSVSVGGGSVVGWFPLGYREPYIPWYSASPAYVRQVNVAHVTNVTNITNITNVTNVTHINYANRSIPMATTAVSGATFTQSRPVRQAVLAEPALRQVARAPVIGGGAPIAPVRESLGGRPVNSRPPETVLQRPVVAVRKPPPAPAPFAVRQAEVAREPNRPFHVRALPPEPSPAASPTARGGAPQRAIAQPPVRVIQPPRPSSGAPGKQPRGGPGATAAPPGAPPQLPGARERGVPELQRPSQFEERGKPAMPVVPPAARPPEAPRPPQPAGVEERARPAPQPPQPPQSPRGEERRAMPTPARPPQVEERAWQQPAPQPPRREERPRPMPAPPSMEERARQASPPPHPEARPAPRPAAAPAPRQPRNEGRPPEKHKGREGEEKREENH